MHLIKDGGMMKTKKIGSWFFLLLMLFGMILIFSPNTVRATDNYYLDFETGYTTGDAIAETWLTSVWKVGKFNVTTEQNEDAYGFGCEHSSNGIWNFTNTDFEDLTFDFWQGSDSENPNQNRMRFTDSSGNSIVDIQFEIIGNTLVKIHGYDGTTTTTFFSGYITDGWHNIKIVSDSSTTVKLGVYSTTGTTMSGNTWDVSGMDNPWTDWNGGVYHVCTNSERFYDEIGYNGGSGEVGNADGNITINVYNESDPSVAIPNWDLLVYDHLGGVYYTANNLNNPVTINHSVYGTGETYFEITADNYYNRTYYADIRNGIHYILDAFLPYDDGTHLYYIVVNDGMDNPVYDVELHITRALNGSLQEIASGFTNIFGAYPIYLIENTEYFVNLSKTGYASYTLQSFVTDPDNYGVNHPIIFYLNISSDEFDVDTFNNVILFCSETSWVSANDTLHISFFDKLSETSDITIHVYESYETNLSFNFSYSYTDTYDIDIWVSGLNTSRMHRIKIISMNHTTLGRVENKSCDIYPMHLDDDAVTQADLESAFRDVGGDFSMGYVNMFILFGPSICIIVGLGRTDPGFGILVGGMYFILCSWHIDLVDNVTIAVLISMLIPLGMIVIAGKRGKKIT